MERHGKFSDELNWSSFKPVMIVPRYATTSVIGYFDNSKYYRNTCAYIGAEIIYEEKKVIVALLPPEDKPIDYYTEEEMTGGDMLLELAYDAKGWEYFLKRAGSLEQMREKLETLQAQRTRQATIATALDSLPLLPKEEILQYGLKMGGKRRVRRATHKRKHSKRRGTRKHY
jgi:hypothetical protein